MLRIIAVLMCAAGVVPVAIAGEQPLICFGNEPSWSVHLTEPGVARFATLSDGTVHARLGVRASEQKPSLGIRLRSSLRAIGKLAGRLGLRPPLPAAHEQVARRRGARPRAGSAAKRKLPFARARD